MFAAGIGLLLGVDARLRAAVYGVVTRSSSFVLDGIYLFVLLAALIVAIVLYVYIDYRSHRRVKAADFDDAYRLRQHAKLVVIPRIAEQAKHHWQRPAYWISYGTVSVLFIAVAVSASIQPVLASTGPGYDWKRVSDARGWSSVAISADGTSRSAQQESLAHVK